MASNRSIPPAIRVNYGQMRTLVAHCGQGDLEKLKQAIHPHSIDPRSRVGWGLNGDGDELGGRVLILYSRPTVEAATQGHHKIVEYLIKNFSDIRTGGYDNEHICALHQAAIQGHVSVVRVILDARFPIEHRDLYGNVPLYIAIRYKKVDVVEYLVSRGSTVNILFHGSTPALVACLSSKSCQVSPEEMAIVECLLTNGTDLSWLAKQDVNPVRQVMKESSLAIEGDLLKRLLKHDPNTVVNFFLEPSFEGSSLPLALVAPPKGWDIREVAESESCPPAIGADILTSIAVYSILTSCGSLSESLKPVAFDMLWKALQIQDKARVKTQVGTKKQRSEREMMSKEELSQLVGQAQESGDPTDLYEQLVTMLQAIYGGSHIVVALALQAASKALYHLEKFESADRLAVRSLKTLLDGIQNRAHFFQEIRWYKEAESVFSFLQGLIEACNSHNFSPSFSTFIELGVQMVEASSSYMSQMHVSKFFLNMTNIFALLQMWSESQVTETFFPSPEAIECSRKLFSYQSIIKVFRRLNINPHSPNDFMTALLPHTPTLNTMDMLGNRPLHFCAEHIGTGGFYSSEHIRETYISLLVSSGAHLDAVNANGQTAYKVCTSPRCKELLKPPQPSSLKCLASHAIVDGGIDYQNTASLPPTLKAYIMLHDPKAPQAKYSHSLF